MIRIKRFPRILVSFYIIGYLFAIFAFLSKTSLPFTITTLLCSALLNALHFMSDEYRSSQDLIRAKKLIDKGEFEKAADFIVAAAKIQPNEEILIQINATLKKKPENYGKTAELLVHGFGEFDSPFIRFVASSFFYATRDLKKAKEVLIEVPLDQMTVKAVRLLGSVLYELGEYERAIKIFSTFDPKTVPKNEDELAVVYGIAICQIARKENKKAIEALSRIKAKSPKYGNAEKLIGQLEGESEKK
jgi:tetratricopeptide (TPR) repeat protein